MTWRICLTPRWKVSKTERGKYKCIGSKVQFKCLTRETQTMLLGSLVLPVFKERVCFRAYQEATAAMVLTEMMYELGVTVVPVVPNNRGYRRRG
jgi:hypothetical protein